MNRLKNIKRITGFLAAVMIFSACEPLMDNKPDIGSAPTENQLDFTINQGSTDFLFSVENTSPVTGIALWDLGNGSKGKGTKVTSYYPLPGEYTITLTLITKGGTASKSKTITTTKTDYSIFTDEKFIFLSGGLNNADGKSWALDSMTTGHLGCGPAGTAGLEWWAAAPLAKQPVKVLYDDYINFKLDGLVATYTNHGKSYVKDYRKDDPAYSNPLLNDSDYAVDFTPEPGSWFIEESGGKSYLTLNASKPLFPIFDVGAVDNKYQIVSLDENFLELVTTGGGMAWHYKLIKKGYVRPTITYTSNVVEGTDNEVTFSVTDYSIPAGENVTNITWNFGDESESVTTTTKDEVVKHTYIRHGTYTVTASLNTSLGTLTTSKSLTLLNDNSAYVPFLLDMMIVYNDFSEVQVFPVLGQDCSVTTVDNPAKIYPDKSSKVGFYTKTNNQYANAYMQLKAGYRFDLRQKHTFRVLVYGKAGDQILLKLENTDKGGNAWQTGTADKIYTIRKDNTWEVAEYDFSGVAAGWNWTGDIYTSDIVTDDRFNHEFYNVIRLMCNPGNGDGTHSFYFDDLSGPHVEGIMK